MLRQAICGVLDGQRDGGDTEAIALDGVVIDIFARATAYAEWLEVLEGDDGLAIRDGREGREAQERRVCVCGCGMLRGRHGRG